MKRERDLKRDVNIHSLSLKNVLYYQEMYKVSFI
jgi:hypothetical protein